MTDTLAQLKAEAARLNARIAELERGQAPKPPPKPVDEGGVRVMEMLTETSALPSPAEMKKLFVAVRHLAPGKLDDRYDEDKPFRGFCAAFRWVQNQTRTEQPNPKFALSYWLDACKSWLRQRDVIANDVDGNSLVLAVYAAGDVCYVPHDLSRGQLWEFGLHEHYGRGRKASESAWRNVMTSGAILPPSRPGRSREVPSSVRMIGF